MLSTGSQSYIVLFLSGLVSAQIDLFQFGVGFDPAGKFHTDFVFGSDMSFIREKSANIKVYQRQSRALPKDGMFIRVAVSVFTA